MEGLGRSCLWLRRELSPPRPQLLLLDCRSRELYESARIGGALSVALPALLLRRLRRGSLSVRALLPGPPLQPPPPAPVLLYDQGGGRHRRGEAEAEAEEWEAESVLGTLLQKLREEGYLAYYLQGRCDWWYRGPPLGEDPCLGDRAPPSEGIRNSSDLQQTLPHFI